MLTIDVIIIFIACNSEHDVCIHVSMSTSCVYIFGVDYPLLSTGYGHPKGTAGCVYYVSSCTAHY